MKLTFDHEGKGTKMPFCSLQGAKLLKNRVDGIKIGNTLHND